MFIPYLSKVCLFLFLSTASMFVVADVYKWVDEEGQTHYSQQAPVGQKTELIKAPPPPASLPEDAQRKVDQLINEQNQARDERNRKVQEQQHEEAQQQQIEESCTRSKNNLQKYMDNPGRRILNSDGEAIRPTEEERQAKIKQLNIDIKEHCK